MNTDASGQNGRGAEDPRDGMAEDARISCALVDIVHQWLLVRRETTPLRDLEEEMGISRSTIHKFERQKSYPRQIWPKLRAWYINDRHARYGAAPDEDPVSHVLSALKNLSHVPASQKPQAMKALAGAHRELCTSLSVPCPAWVELLEEMADAEARQHPPRHESSTAFRPDGAPAAKTREGGGNCPRCRSSGPVLAGLESIL